MSGSGSGMGVGGLADGVQRNSLKSRSTEALATHFAQRMQALEMRLSMGPLFRQKKEEQVLRVSIAHEIANPSALGLFAMALTTVFLQGAVTGVSGAATMGWATCFALGYGGLAMIFAGLLDFRRNSIFGGTVFTSYGSFWLSFAAYVILTNYPSAEPGVGILPASAKGEQFVMAVWGVYTFTLLIPTFALNGALVGLFFLLGTYFLLLAGGVKNATCYKVAGWWGIATAVWCYYVAAAVLIDDVYNKEILPVFIFRKKQHAEDPNAPDIIELPGSKPYHYRHGEDAEWEAGQTVAKDDLENGSSQKMA